MYLITRQALPIKCNQATASLGPSVPSLKYS